MRTTLLFLCTFIAHSVPIHSQTIQNDVLSSSGGSFANANSLDWTLGETVIDLYANTVKLHQGFHQVSTESISTNSDDLTIEPIIGVFPNPTTDLVQIHSDQDLSNTQLSILNVSGKVVISKQLQSSDNQISIRQLPEGMYMLLLRSPLNQRVIKLVKSTN
jgi:hypothetical protein